MVKPVLMVAAGGALGSLCRVGLSLWILRHAEHRFWLGTFLVNMLACLLVGVLAAVLAERFEGDHPFIQFALIAGFTGGFSTFSAFSLENLRLLENGGWWAVTAYAGASVLLGLALVRGGYALGRTLFGG